MTFTGFIRPTEELVSRLNRRSRIKTGAKNERLREGHFFSP